MASNGRGSSNRSAGASNTVAATAMGSVETRFPQREWRWGCCLGGLSCFASQKGGRRIAPGVPEGNTSTIRANGPQPVGLTNQATTITPSLLAPPSSPASFTNSALPSTAQSPSCFLSISANSPGGPSSTMFATGPYAHETQLVSPPGFSAVTTEPSTAPLTPPPELAHHTTPSSPDVPFAHFRSSSMDLKNAGKSSYTAANDLQATYPLYHGSPASSLISPILGTSGDGVSSSFTGQESPTQWGASISTQGSQFPQSGSSRLFGLGTATSKNFMLSQDSSFFCPATSAQFYLDQAQQSFPHCGPRLSLSREADVYSSGGNGHQNRHSKNCKPDAEEIEAYRASFGFSADEIITTPQYVEISDVLDESFTMTPFASSDKPFMEQSLAPKLLNKEKMQTSQNNLLDHDKGVDGVVQDKSCNGCEADYKSQKQSGNVSEPNEPGDYVSTDEEDIFLKMGDSNISKRYRLGLSSSDAEIDYRRGRSLREGKGDFSWRD